MKREIAEKWVAALRSGEFKQGRHALRSDDGHCCLGVLCELYDREHHFGWATEPQRHRGVYMGQSVVLPQDVIEWAALSDLNPDIPDGSGETIAQRNDNGYSFEQIAALIEQHTEAL